MRRLIIIGTRGNKLALYQANKLNDELHAHKIESELKIINNDDDEILPGDKIDVLEKKDSPANEIEKAILSKKIDIAVHSLRDMSIHKIPGLVIGGLSERENPSDLLIINKESVDKDKLLSIKSFPVIGVSSVRRNLQISNILKNAEVKRISGNYSARIEKLRQKNFDAIILAEYIVENLKISLEEFHVIRLHPKEFIPAPGQGIIAYQCRSEDIELRKILQHVHHKSVADCSNIERVVMYQMNNDSLGVYCEKDAQNNFHAYATCVNPGDETLKFIRLSQSTSVNLANRIVEQLKH